MAGQLTDATAVSAALLRPLKANEDAVIDELIDQVSTKLRSKLPTVDARIALFQQNPTDPPPPALDPAAVRAMLAGVLRSYLVNPTGAASVSSGTGPYNSTTTFASRALANGSYTNKLVVTDQDVAELFQQSGNFIGAVALNVPSQHVVPFRAYPGGSLESPLSMTSATTVSLGSDTDVDDTQTSEAPES